MARWPDIFDFAHVMRIFAVIALLIAAACEQAERAISGALPPRKAIAEVGTLDQRRRKETPEPGGCGRLSAQIARSGRNQN